MSKLKKMGGSRPPKYVWWCPLAVTRFRCNAKGTPDQCRFCKGEVRLRCEPAPVKPVKAKKNR